MKDKSLKEKAQKIFQVFLPLIVFILVDDCLYLILEVIVTNISGSGSSMGDFIITNMTSFETVIQGVSKLVAALVLFKTISFEIAVSDVRKDGDNVFPEQIFADGTVAASPEIKKTTWKSYLGLISLSAIIALVITLLLNLTGLVGSDAGYAVVWQRQFLSNRGIQVAVYGLLTPLAEELIFRGVIQNRLIRLVGERNGIIITALLFAVYHFNLVQGIYAFIMGIIFGFYYRRYRKITIPYAMHAAANIVSLFI